MKKLNKTQNILTIIGLLIVFSMISQCRENMKDSPANLKLEAARECGKRFVSSAKYQADVWESMTAAADAGDGFWRVVVFGEMTDAFGSKGRFMAECTYNGNSEKVESFNLTEDNG